MKKVEELYSMVTDIPMAGRTEVHTKKEWKRIYGYEFGFVTGVKFVKQEKESFLSQGEGIVVRNKSTENRITKFKA